MKLSDQYIAGFFDGEGCIHIGTYKAYGNIQHRLQISIAQNDVTVLQALADRFGGKLHPQGSRTAMQWHLWCNKAYDFLKAIYPHLILKKEQAELAIAFTNFLHQNPIAPGGASALMDPAVKEDIRYARQWYANELKELKSVMVSAA